MEKKTYIIIYEAKSDKGVLLKSGKIKVKNKTSSIQAQISLENYLRRNLSNFSKMIVKSCKEDSINSIFGDIFGKDNPFNF